jgi:signal transduction histidine kinase
MMASALLSALEAEGSPHAERLRHLVTHIEQVNARSRAVTKGLIPVEVDAEGLMAALAELAEQTEKLYQLPCTFLCQRRVPLADSFTATQMFRIAQEAVHNAVKHAKAKQIDIRLEDPGQTRLSVHDDGTGIAANSSKTGRGVQIMRHRASLIGAELHLASPPEGGTIISCFLRGKK